MAEVDETEIIMNYHGDFSKLDQKASRYPYCIVWTPIPILSWVLPFIGHMGICTSSGIIRDFAGSYFVSEDNMGFGRPTKYWKLDVDKVCGNGAATWDKAVHDASEEYKCRPHLLEHGQPVCAVSYSWKTCELGGVPQDLAALLHALRSPGHVHPNVQPPVAERPVQRDDL
ncbi:transmembrane protein 222-like isoform 2-T2 [Spinachia spinachia]